MSSSKQRTLFHPQFLIFLIPSSTFFFVFFLLLLNYFFLFFISFHSEHVNRKTKKKRRTREERNITMATMCSDDDVRTCTHFIFFARNFRIFSLYFFSFFRFIYFSRYKSSKRKLLFLQSDCIHFFPFRLLSTLFFASSLLHHRLSFLPFFFRLTNKDYVFKHYFTLRCCEIILIMSEAQKYTRTEAVNDEKWTTKFEKKIYIKNSMIEFILISSDIGKKKKE